jgi:hypothetical protein
MRVPLYAALLIPLLAGAAPAATAPSPAVLAQISARGRALFLYDATAAAATDAVTAKFGTTVALPTGERMVYIGRPTAAGWIFDFGALSVDGNTFTILYRAVQAGLNSGRFNLSQPAGAAAQGDGFDVAAARGLLLAMGHFAYDRTVRYDYAVLQRADGGWYVYLYPAYTSYTDPQFGADGRFTISANGANILENHRMHNSLITEGANLPHHAQAEAGFHTDVVDDVPEDSDVFHVLLRRPRIPDYVGATGHLYRINPDGSIDDLGVVH